MAYELIKPDEPKKEREYFILPASEGRYVPPPPPDLEKTGRTPPPPPPKPTEKPKDKA